MPRCLRVILGLALRGQGIPVIGFTWYSLIDQRDWDIGLAIDRGIVTPAGLFDLNREPRPVAHAYKRMVRHFGDEPLLPGTSLFSL